jgi:predicted ester cyclase
LSPMVVYGKFQQYLFTGKIEKMGEVIDLPGYTENCVGLTGWTTGFDVALKNFMSGFGAAFSDLKPSIQTVVETKDSAIVRSRVEARHTGPFLGMPPTGKTIVYEYVDWFTVKDGKIHWRWIFFDLHGIEQQLKGGPAPKY